MYFLDESVSVTPPQGHNEPLPILLGPGRQANDIRMVFIAGAGSSSSAALFMPMSPDPITDFTAAYNLDPSHETHGVYWRRLQDSDTDTRSVSWMKPNGWLYFMFATLTARGVDPAGTITAGSKNIDYTTGDSTGTTATCPSITVPSAGVVVVMVGSVAAWGKDYWPKWPVAIGVPTGWTPIAATDKSGATFAQYDNSPSLVVVAKSFSSAGSTGSIVFPTTHGAPAFGCLYAHLPAPQNVTATISAA